MRSSGNGLGWKARLKRLLLDFDARLDFGVFQGGSWSRELFERFSDFMDRFHVAGWRRWLLIEPFSEAATFGACGLVLMLTLATPAFLDTADEDWLRKSEIAVVFLDRYGNEVGSRGVKQNDSIALDEMPDHLLKAVLATEDRRFYDHFGIDVPGTLRALVTNARAGGVRQGGSSITQQLAKNIFLNNERTIERKITEAFLALWLESRLTKNEILKLYLDRAYMGGGTFGVNAAAQYYFGKSARDVNLSEAAMLAGLFKAPTKFAPHINLPAARARANTVLDNLVEAGFMTEGQVFGARRNPATPIDRRDDSAPNYYLDKAFDEMTKLSQKLPKSITERSFTARLALDMNVQHAAENAIESMLKQYGREYNAHQAAAVLADLDGGVRAMVGGRDYGTSQFNRATDAMRQPGSSFKPYVYATALANGFTPNYDRRRWADLSRQLVPSQLWRRLCRSSDPHAGHYSLAQHGRGASLGRNRQEEGRRERRQARPLHDRRHRAAHGHHDAPSRHAVAADRRRRGHHVRARGRLRDLPEQGNGGHPAHHSRGPRRERRDDLALRPRWTQAAARDHRASRRRYGVMMNKVVEEGTARRAMLNGVKAAGKTGTTNGYRDAWFVGYTGNYVCGVWFGNDDYAPLNRMTGGALPAQTWHEIMAYAHQGVELKNIPGLPPNPSTIAPPDLVSQASPNSGDMLPRPALLTQRGTQVLLRIERAMEDAVRTLPATGQSAEVPNLPGAPSRSIATATEQQSGQQGANSD